jgi:hypothetical protein
VHVTRAAAAAINDTENKCTFALDKRLMDQPTLWFHPLHNDKSTSVSAADLVKFLEATGHPPMILDFSDVPPPGSAPPPAAKPAKPAKSAKGENKEQKPKGLRSLSLRRTRSPLPRGPPACCCPRAQRRAARVQATQRAARRICRRRRSLA